LRADLKEAFGELRFISLWVFLTCLTQAFCFLGDPRFLAGERLLAGDFLLAGIFLIYLYKKKKREKKLIKIEINFDYYNNK